MPKNYPKTYVTKQQNIDVLNGGIWRCLRRGRDIGTKTMLATSKQFSVEIPP